MSVDGLVEEFGVMNAVAVDRDTREAVEAFMFREAELLDGGAVPRMVGSARP